MENKQLRGNISALALNTATDTGFLFEVGNAAIGFAASPEAGCISLGVSALCFAARATGEAKKLGITFNLREKFNNAVTRRVSGLVSRMSENLGTSLMISGGALLVSSLCAAFRQADASSLHRFLESARPAAILASFGIANGLRGLARGLKNGGLAQRVLDVTGITLASAGVIMAGRDLNLAAVAGLEPASIADAAVKGSFAGAAGMAVYQAVKALPSRKFLQPDLLFAAGCFGNAAMSPTPRLAFANAVFGVAFMSLDALKKNGGMSESLRLLRAPKA